MNTSTTGLEVWLTVCLDSVDRYSKAQRDYAPIDPHLSTMAEMKANQWKFKALRTLREIDKEKHLASQPIAQLTLF